MERQIRAFGLELLFGYMGFLGIGWLYGRRWAIGIPLLLVWYPFLFGCVLAIINAPKFLPNLPAAAIGALALLPIYLAVPLASAYGIRRRLERELPPTEPVAPAADAPERDRPGASAAKPNESADD